MELSELAARLDADEKLKLTYRFPVRLPDGHIDYETREGKLLDIAEESGLFYVSHDGDVLWVKAEEAIEVKADD